MNLQRLIEQYISYQRSLGSSFIIGCNQFSGLSAVPAAREPALPVFAFEHVDAFLGKARPVTKTWFTKLSCLRCFFRYAASRGYITTLPLPTVMPKRPPAIRSLHLHAGRTPPPSPGNRVLSAGHQHPGAGDDPHDDSGVLRGRLALCEATNLTRADVDLSGSVLTIRNTKFGKTRLVPVGPQLNRVLVQYDRTRPKGRPADAPFFTTQGRVVPFGTGDARTEVPNSVQSRRHPSD